MEPKLNIKIADMWALEPGADVSVDFTAPGAQMPNDYIREDSVETDKFKAIQDAQRADQARQYDRDNQIGQSHAKDPNPAQQVGPYAYTQEKANMQVAASQAVGFRNKQARKNVTAGVLADIKNDTLVGGRVLFKTAAKQIEGTVIAVGDKEFAVIWDDRTASVERKADFELVVAE